MADPEHFHFGPPSHQNGQPPQHQLSFHSSDMQDLSFEGADFWTFREGIFDFPEADLLALSAPGTQLRNNPLENVDEDDRLIIGRCMSGTNHPQAVTEDAVAYFDDDGPDLALHSENFEEVGRRRTYPIHGSCRDMRLTNMPDCSEQLWYVCTTSPNPDLLILAGVGYWLSVCSSHGIAWIRQQVKSDEFAEIAEDLKASWAQQLRLEHTEPRSKAAEPDPQLAWQYCNGMLCDISSHSVKH